MSKVSDLSTRDLQWTTLNKPFQGPANYHYEEQLRRKRQNNNNNNKKKTFSLVVCFLCFCAILREVDGAKHLLSKSFTENDNRDNKMKALCVNCENNRNANKERLVFES